MTPEEAIEILQEEHDYAQLVSYVNKALNLGIEALEKQIPKRPYKKTINYHCDVCKQYLCDENKTIYGGLHNYCPICGQALDWSVKNDYR